MVKTIVMSVGSCHEACHKHRRETLELLTEMEVRMKMVRDLTDHGVSDMHARSVLIGIFDPMTGQHTANNLSESFEVFKTAVLEFATAAGMLQKDVSKLDPMQIEKVAGPTQCASLVQDFGCVGSEACGEVVVIWKGRTFRLLGHMLVATTVGEKGILPGIVRQKGWENEAFQGKGLHREKGSPKVKRGGEFDKGGKCPGKEPAGGCWICGGQHYAKECTKGQGKAYHLAEWSEGAGTNEVRELEGSLRAIESGPVKQTTQKVVVTEYVLKAVRHCGPLVTGSR